MVHSIIVCIYKLNTKVLCRLKTKKLWEGVLIIISYIALFGNESISFNISWNKISILNKAEDSTKI